MNYELHPFNDEHRGEHFYGDNNHIVKNSINDNKSSQIEIDTDIIKAIPEFQDKTLKELYEISKQFAKSIVRFKTL